MLRKFFLNRLVEIFSDYSISENVCPHQYTVGPTGGATPTTVTVTDAMTVTLVFTSSLHFNDKVNENRCQITLQTS